MLVVAGMGLALAGCSGGAVDGSGQGSTPPRGVSPSPQHSTAKPSPSSVQLPIIDPNDSFQKKGKAKVLSVAKAYGLTYVRVGYAEYPPKTSRYAEHYGFADGYFDLTPLANRTLSQTDYESLAPVLLWNTFYTASTYNFAVLNPQGKDPGTHTGKLSQLLEPDYDSGTFTSAPRIKLEQTEHSHNRAYVLTFSHVPVSVADMERQGTTDLDSQIGFGPSFSGPTVDMQLFFDSITGNELYTTWTVTY
jgi:hypothetical protein